MVVSIILLAVGGVSAMICIAAGTRLTSISNEYATAAELAHERLAAVVTQIAVEQDQFSASDQQGDFGADHPGFTWEQKIETTELPDLVRVTITISWSASAAQRNAQFVTYERIPQASTSTSGTTSQ
jgi:hypothetical protein